jgi:23S rRNA (pseudouridine1915-N3)-methyltransferase
MLKIKFIVVDRTRSPFLREGEIHYLNRLKRYAQIEWIEIKPSRIKKGRSEQEILDSEGREITRRLNSRDYLIALDLSGKQYDSEGLASWLKDLHTGIRGKLCFVVGGPVGLSNVILDQADTILSLSRLTLTHEMSRLFLIEQLYRAFTIIEGHRYHR